MPIRKIRKMEGFDKEKLFVLPDYAADELAEHTLTSGLHVTDIGYFPNAKYHYRERLDGCDSHIMIYCVSGNGWVELIGKGKETRETYEMREQSIIFLPVGIPHRYRTIDDDPWSIYWFHLKGTEVQPLLEAFHLLNGPVSVPLGFTVKFIEAFEQCYRLLIDRPYSLPSHIHIAQTIRQQISSLGMTAGGTAQEKKRDRYIDQAIRYMTEHIEETITLDELARHIGLSRQHLIQIFNDATGFPPIDYYLRMKMQRAGQLLDLTDLSVKEIGSSLGFHDPYYFSRVFKKIIGQSPSQYRSIEKG